MIPAFVEVAKNIKNVAFNNIRLTLWTEVARKTTFALSITFYLNPETVYYLGHLLFRDRFSS